VKHQRLIVLAQDLLRTLQDISKQAAGVAGKTMNRKSRGPKTDSLRSETAPGRTATLKMKRLTLDISEDLHRAIKLDAVHAGVTMVDRLRALLLKHYGLAVGSRKETT
jgi:hypothetical protein